VRARKTPVETGEPVRLTDPRAIRALAHPARLAVIDALYAGGEMTATECAAVVGLSPSAMSYHLRSLEKAGIVERAPSTGDGRERPWRAAGSHLQVESGSAPGNLAASQALNATVMSRTLSELDDWIARRSDEDKEWDEASSFTNGQAWLTVDEARELSQHLRAALDRYRGRRFPEKRPAGARRVRVSQLVFPIDPPQPSA
jgi:DNA-binding transcriptional ArsR family regulator